ncbi:hypothetical protein CHELA1G2_10730 [Hyphomicrobiales bacterium]|nr:hypothetical protein CHELA1G2_10730 [Hyphomicrobiales bacterium]
MIALGRYLLVAAGEEAVDLPGLVERAMAETDDARLGGERGEVCGGSFGHRAVEVEGSEAR